jgi:preprotein translocase subunit SecY
LSANPLATLGKLGDLKRRLWFLVGALVVYRIGTFIPVPGIDLETRACSRQTQGGILDMFNMFSGGRCRASRSSRSASCRTFLGLDHHAVADGGLAAAREPSRRKARRAGAITQYTRYGTVVLAFQALGISIALESQPGLVIDPGLAFRFTTVLTLTTGTMFLMWLGEQITERGIGNGISMIDLRGDRGGPAARDRRQPRAGAHRRHGPFVALVVFAR